MAETLERPLCDCHGLPMHRNGRNPNGTQAWYCPRRANHAPVDAEPPACKCHGEPMHRAGSRGWACARKRAASYRRKRERLEADPEALAAHRATYRERMAAWNAAHADDEAVRARKREAWSRWYDTPAGKAAQAEKAAAYRARKAGAPVVEAIGAAEREAILAEHGDRCAYCGAGGELVLDHYVPLAGGGEHSRRNLVPACPPCNAAKGDRDPFLFDRARLLGWA